MKLRRHSSTPPDAASQVPKLCEPPVGSAPRETSGTEGSNPPSSSAESRANLSLCGSNLSTGRAPARVARSRQVVFIPTCSRPRPPAKAEFSPAMTGCRTPSCWRRHGRRVGCYSPGMKPRLRLVLIGRAAEHAGFAERLFGQRRAAVGRSTSLKFFLNGIVDALTGSAANAKGG